MTGAGSRIGIGRAIALALVGAGARVAMVDIDGESLEATAAEARKTGGAESVSTCVADVAQFEEAERAIRQAVDSLGGLHVLVNNAGVNPRFRFWELPPDAWARTIATNVNGPFFMAKAAATHMRTQGWGRIIGVTTSLDTMLHSMPYGPSKAAHEAFMAVLAREVEGSGVTANIVIPGHVVYTEMTRGLGDRGRMLEPDVMQGPVVWLASDESDGFNGWRIIAHQWDESLPLDKRLEVCSAPAAWPQLGPTR